MMVAAYGQLFRIAGDDGCRYGQLLVRDCQVGQQHARQNRKASQRGICCLCAIDCHQRGGYSGQRMIQTLGPATFTKPLEAAPACRRHPLGQRRRRLQAAVLAGLHGLSCGTMCRQMQMLRIAYVVAGLPGARRGSSRFHTAAWIQRHKALSRKKICERLVYCEKVHTRANIRRGDWLIFPVPRGIHSRVIQSTPPARQGEVSLPHLAGLGLFPVRLPLFTASSGESQQLPEASLGR